MFFFKLKRVLQKPLSKKRVVLLLAILVLGSLFFIFIAPVHALPQVGPGVPGNGASGTPDEQSLIARFLSWVVFGLLSLLGKLLVAVIGILIPVANYNEFSTSLAIAKGWVIVRDVCNMFFVAVFMVMAFYTVLKWQDYHYSKVLAKIILMAILINFSKGISLFLIDFSQVVMLTFVNAFSSASYEIFTTRAGLEGILSFRDQGKEAVGNASWEVMMALIFGLIMITVYLVTVLAILLVLLTRIITLWFLVILSPFAYLASVFPKAEKYSGQWWSKFGEQLFRGPVLAFFLWLSLTIATSNLSSSIVSDANKLPGENFSAGAGGNFGVTISAASRTDNILSFVLMVGLLLLALAMTSQMGGMAGTFSQGAVRRLQSAGTAPLKLAGAGFGAGAKAATGYAGRKYKDWAAGGGRWRTLMNPVAVYRGWKERGKELGEQAETAAAAKGRELVDYVRTGKKVRTPHVDRVESGFEAEYAKEYSMMNKEQKAFMMEKLMGMKGVEGQRRRRALIRVAADAGHLDDVMGSEYFRKKAKWVDQNGDEQTGYENKETGEFYNHEILNDFLRNTIGDHEQGLRTIYELEEVGKRTKHQEYGGHSIYDEKTGKFKMLSGEKSTQKAISELTKTPGRALMGDSPHDFVSLRLEVVRDKEGNIVYETDDKGNEIKDAEGNRIAKKAVAGGALDDFNLRAIMAAFTGRLEQNITEHSQARTAEYLLGRADDIDKDGRLMIDETSLERIKQLAKINPEMIKGFWKKIGGVGEFKAVVREKDQDGKEIKMFIDAKDLGISSKPSETEGGNTGEKEKSEGGEKGKSKASPTIVVPPGAGEYPPPRESKTYPEKKKE